MLQFIKRPFRYSTKLQEAGRICGLDLAHLQQCVYMLSVAIKDYDVVTWLSILGLGYGQLHLLGYMISDTEDEHRIWEAVCANLAQRKLALALFLKTILPIAAMVSLNVERAEIIKNKWHGAIQARPKSFSRFTEIVCGSVYENEKNFVEQALNLKEKEGRKKTNDRRNFQ
mgnify:CR=1 FL=1